MSIYLVTYKTCVINGENSEGSFISQTEIDSAESALAQRDLWLEYAKEKNPHAKGGDFLITGAFKL